MAGIKQWSKNVEVQANPSKRIRELNLDFTTEIGVGLDQAVNIFAPAGYVARILNMTINYPVIAGATSGDKKIFMLTGNGIYGITQGVGDYNKELKFDYYGWDNATSSKPTDIMSIFGQAIFDENDGVRITFRNTTNAADGGVKKTLRLFVEEEKIG